ncbi:MAG: hypothetical protein ACREIA_18855 [Opitutaceae bacterium]
MSDRASHATSAVPAPQAAERWIPLALGLCVLLPLIVFVRQWKGFFWFGDDWDLLWQIDEIALWPWVLKPWAESFSPLFKTVWGSSVFIFGGSYFAFIIMLWLANAATVAVMARLLRQAGFSWGSIAPAVLILGTSATTIETMSWSVQLSPLLANLFFCIAVLLFWNGPVQNPRWTLATHLPAILAALASALCYSRGILTGFILALMAFWPFVPQRSAGFRQRCLTAVGFVAPGFLVVFVVLTMAGGNQRSILQTDFETFARMVEYGAWYFFVNPFHALLHMDSMGPRTTLTLGALKVALIVFAFRKTTPDVRWLLLVMLLYDLANSAVLGLGRYHTGLGTVASSRYQHCAMTSYIPFFAILFQRLGSTIRATANKRIWATTSIALLVLVLQLSLWPAALRNYVAYRGQQTREAFLNSPHPPAGYRVPGIPFMPVEKAEELVRDYNLH